MTDEEREIILAKREYHRNWRERNKEKVKEINRRFYKKQAEKNREGKK